MILTKIIKNNYSKIVHINKILNNIIKDLKETNFLKPKTLKKKNKH